MTAKEMAYGGSKQDPLAKNNFRLARGYPYVRAGQPVVAMPQFNGLYLYTPTARNIPTGFRQTMTETRVRRPIAPVPNPTSGV